MYAHCQEGFMHRPNYIRHCVLTSLKPMQCWSLGWGAAGRGLTCIRTDWQPNWIGDSSFTVTVTRPILGCKLRPVRLQVQFSWEMSSVWDTYFWTAEMLLILFWHSCYIACLLSPLAQEEKVGVRHLLSPSSPCFCMFYLLPEVTVIPLTFLMPPPRPPHNQTLP